MRTCALSILLSFPKDDIPRPLQSGRGFFFAHFRKFFRKTFGSVIQMSLLCNRQNIYQWAIARMPIRQGAAEECPGIDQGAFFMHLHIASLQCMPSMGDHHRPAVISRTFFIPHGLIGRCFGEHGSDSPFCHNAKTSTNNEKNIFIHGSPLFSGSHRSQALGVAAP